MRVNDGIRIHEPYCHSLTDASLESQYSPKSHRPTLIASADVISSKLSMILRMIVGLFFFVDRDDNVHTERIQGKDKRFDRQRQINK